jgi:DNA polymerase-3 subunit beta
MKFICILENLKKGLNNTVHLAGRNQNLPILNNVLLETKNGVLLISSTNLEVGIKSAIRGKVEEEGSLTVPARLFYEYIQNIKSEKIEISTKGLNLEIKTDNSHTTLKGLDYSEFPLIPEIEKKYKIEILAGEIKESLSLVLFATALDSARPEISGVLFDFTENNLILAATDSYRLAEKKLKVENKIEFDKKIIIPSFTLQELARLVGDVDKKSIVKMYLNENQVAYEIENTIMISRTTEGEYPDYKQIIPQKNSKTEALTNRQQLQQSVKAASLFCRQGINDINLVFLKEKIEIKALNDQLGESQNAIPVELEGEENEIVFNYHYLLDVLSSLNSENIKLKINNNSLPGMIIPQEREDYLYIIMPIKQ